KLLANYLDRACLDTDELVVRAAGISIREIFEREGESGFRMKERAAVALVTQQSGVVISAGGGSVTDVQSREMLRAGGHVIWLRASPEELWRRISADEWTPDLRPALTDAGGLVEVQRLMVARESLYQSIAASIIDTELHSATEVCQL